MREIVHIQVGEWGNRVGSRFIDIISDEHGLDQTGTYHGDSNLQLDMINTYFNESSYCKYSPRAVLVDLDSSVVDSIKSGSYGQLYNPDNFITGSHGTGGNWAKGYLTEGADLIDYALDSIRKEAEEWDLLYGFQFVNSLEGGTGSGMGSLILSHLKDEYPDKIILSFPIFSSQKASYTIIFYWFII